MKKLRALIIGSKRLSVSMLETLVADGHDVVGVFSRDSDPSMEPWLNQLGHPSLSKAAKAHSIRVYENIKVNSEEGIAILQNANADIIFSCFWGEILNEKVLNIPRLGIFNLHAALLPKNRGSRPIPWAMIKGEKETGITLHKMLTGVDNGPIVASASVTISEADTCISLYDKVTHAGAALFKRTLPEFARGTYQLRLQTESNASYNQRGEPYGGRIHSFWSVDFKQKFRNALHFPPFQGAKEAPQPIASRPCVYLTSVSVESMPKLELELKSFHSDIKSIDFRRKFRHQLDALSGLPVFIPLEREEVSTSHKLLDMLLSARVLCIITNPSASAENLVSLQPMHHRNGVFEIPLLDMDGSREAQKKVDSALSLLETSETDIHLVAKQPWSADLLGNQGRHLALEDLLAKFTDGRQ